MPTHTFGYESNGSYVEWSVDDFWEAAKSVPPVRERLISVLSKVETTILEYSDDDFKRAEEADLSYPVILSPAGSLVLDGVHRLYRLNQLGSEWVMVKFLIKMPSPIAVRGDALHINF